MKCPIYLVTVLSVALSGMAQAADVNDTNIFNPGLGTAAIVNATSNYSSSTFNPSNADNLQSSSFVFGDYLRGNGAASTNDPNQYLSFTSVSASSGIDSVRFYSEFSYEAERVATQVTIYVSNTNLTDPTASLDLSNYTALNGGTPFTLALDINGNYVDGIGTTSGIHYDTLAGLGIAAGTQSILFDFGPERSHTAFPSYNVGTGFSEIQAFAAAPEPSTYALMLGGLVVLGFARRRSRLSLN